MQIRIHVGTVTIEWTPASSDNSAAMPPCRLLIELFAFNLRIASCAEECVDQAGHSTHAGKVRAYTLA